MHRATAAFTVNGKAYPAGSIVVKTAQAFRPHVLDMFEPQDHPHDVAYPGGPPIPPYDSAGWTLAYQMGMEFDRVLDAFDGPFERLTTFIAADRRRWRRLARRRPGYLVCPRPRTTPSRRQPPARRRARRVALSAAPGRRRHVVVE